MKVKGSIKSAADTESPISKAQVKYYVGDTELANIFSDEHGLLGETDITDKYVGKTLICKVDKEGFESQEVKYKLEQDKTTIEIEIRLVEKRWKLKLEVKDGEEKPVNDATVSLELDGDVIGKGTSDSRGHVEIAIRQSHENKTVKYKAEKGGYTESSGTVMLEQDLLLPITLNKLDPGISSDRKRWWKMGVAVVLALVLIGAYSVLGGILAKGGVVAIVTLLVAGALALGAFAFKTIDVDVPDVDLRGLRMIIAGAFILKVFGLSIIALPAILVLIVIDLLLFKFLSSKPALIVTNILVLCVIIGLMVRDDSHEETGGASLKIVEFTADPTRIKVGEAATLSWATANANHIEISGIGEVEDSGTYPVTPSETTTYTLTATGDDKSKHKEVSVVVDASDGPASFAVTNATLTVEPETYVDPCPPGRFKFSGEITANGHGKVTYTFFRSDGEKSAVQELNFNGPGTQAVNTSWTLSGEQLPQFKGWQSLRVLSPNELVSNRASFSVNCEQESVGPTFDVILVKTGINQRLVARKIEQLTPHGRQMAKRFAESEGPETIVKGISRHKAEEIKSELTRARATVEIVPSGN